MPLKAQVGSHLSVAIPKAPAAVFVAAGPRQQSPHPQQDQFLHDVPRVGGDGGQCVDHGVCFSDEPTISIYGEFGVRLEDCFYMTESGPRLFTKQSQSIDPSMPMSAAVSQSPMSA